jgi:hypothetical protein
MCVFGCPDASVAKLIELIKVRQLDFELQSRAAPVAPRQRNQNAAIKAAVARCLEFPPNVVQRLLAVDVVQRLILGTNDDGTLRPCSFTVSTKTLNRASTQG